MAHNEREIDIIHARADHEDNLHVNRTAAFIGLNGLIAVAVGLAIANIVKSIFALMILVVDVAWIMWGGRAAKYILKLRNAGNTRCDQQLLVDLITERKLPTPLKIMSVLMPWVATVAWFFIFAYFIWQTIAAPFASK
jgi:type IV secretory pathway TrbD component